MDMKRTSLLSIPEPSAKLHPYLKNYLGYCFYKAAARIRGKVDRRLAEFGVVAPQFGMLIILQQAGGMTQGELGSFMDIDKATMVRMIDGLETKGFLTRTTTKSDRRAKRLEITKLGAKNLLKMNKARMRAEEEFLTDLGTQEQAQLRSIVSKLISPTK